MTDQPGYTRMPNALFDLLPTLGNAELRVLLAVARKTHGWQKECDVISVSQLATMTGLTSRNTQNAIVALLEKGLIARAPAGKQRYCYTLQTISPRDTDQNHIPSEPIVTGDTVPYPLGTRLDTKPYPLGITQKKDSKEKKERDVTRERARRVSPPPAEKKETTPLVVIQALADICVLDRRMITKKDHIILAQAANVLYQDGKRMAHADEEIATVISGFLKWFKVFDFRGQKGEAPTPDLVRRLWPQYIQWRKKSSTGVAIPTRPTAPPDAQTTQESAARMLALRGKPE